MSGDADSLEYGKSLTQSPTSAIWYTFALEISAVLIDKKDSFTNAAKGKSSNPPWVTPTKIRSFLPIRTVSGYNNKRESICLSVYSLREEKWKYGNFLKN